MAEKKELFDNDYVTITKEDDTISLGVKKIGFNYMQFKKIIDEHEDIELLDVKNIKKQLKEISKTPVIIGSIVRDFDIEISQDMLEAYVKLNLKKEEYDTELKLEKFKKEVRQKLEEFEVTENINLDNIKTTSKKGEKILVAHGTQEIDGTDSEIKMYEIDPPKAKIDDSGKVNFYNIDIINPIYQGDWLGEMTDPTDGIPGITVTGKEIQPKKGASLKLDYDKNSVSEHYDEEKKITILKADKTGAVSYTNNTIGVNECFNVEKDVNYAVGNIDFNGFVNVKGTVADNFEVIATDDIQIMGKLGVGKVKKIESKEGSISIQGGVNGKNVAHIKAKKDIHLKFASDAIIECEGAVHIGFYALNCDIIAREVIIESSKGKLIGGKINAAAKVEVNEIGNDSSTFTYIKLIGYDKEDYREKLHSTENDVERIDKTIQKFKDDIAKSNDHSEINRKKDNINKLKGKLKYFNEEIKNYKKYIKQKGEGAIIVNSRIHPNTFIEIKHKMRVIREDINSRTTFYFEDDNIHEG